MTPSARDLFARFRRRQKPEVDPIDRPVTFRDLARIAYETAHFDGVEANRPDPLMESFQIVVYAQAEGRKPVGRRRDWEGARRAVTWDELRRTFSAAGRRGKDRPASTVSVTNYLLDGAFEVLTGRDER